MTAKECGEFIAVLRKKNGLTQKQLAVQLNVSDKAVSRWETGKGYPDVASLMALSNFFGISVNELLAGKIIQSENLKEIADENVLSAFKESEKNKKKQSAQTAFYTVFLLAVLLPVLIIIIKEWGSVMYAQIISGQIQTENIISSVVSAVIALALLIVGRCIRRGNLSVLHLYHYQNVTDLIGYAKEMGNAVSFMSIPIFINSFLSLSAQIKAVQIVSAVLLFAGMIMCIIHIFKIQVKYNGDLF